MGAGTKVPSCQTELISISRHSRAIAREIGERLRASFTEEPELPAGLKEKIERLRELEGLPPK
jgi:hypothetical protein